MKSANSLGVIQRSGTRSGLVVVLVLVGLFSFSCRKPVAPPPPPQITPTEEPPPPPAAPSISFSAQPSSIERGEETTLQWQAQNADSVRIDPGVGLGGNVGPQGRQSLFVGHLHGNRHGSGRNFNRHRPRHRQRPGTPADRTAFTEHTGADDRGTLPRQRSTDPLRLRQVGDSPGSGGTPPGERPVPAAESQRPIHHQRSRRRTR